MVNTWKVLALLLHKNLIVRKRHWCMTLFLQALVPIGLFALLQAARDFSVELPKVINESTHYSVDTQDELMEYLHNNFSEIYYLPKNEYTDEIMESARNCLQLLPESKCYCYLYKI